MCCNCNDKTHASKMKAFEVDNTVFSLFVTFDVVVLAAGNSEHLTVCIRCGTEAILFTP